MSKLTKAWVDAQIEHEFERGCHAEAVRDLAALIIVRKHLCEGEECEMPAAMVEGHRAQHEEHRHGHERLSKETILAWVDSMVDDDGVKGGKYTWHQAQQYAMNMGITGQQRLLEFFWAMNAMYADYHKVGKKFGVDKPEYYACMAKAFLMDKDAGQHKLRKYMEMIPKG